MKNIRGNFGLVIYFHVPKCGKEKMLWKIWHKDYGVIYDIRETRNMEEILYEPKENRTQVHRKILQISLL